MEKKKTAKKAKKKVEKIDGLNPKEIVRIRGNLRDVWRNTYSRNLVVKRAVGKDGFSYCESCLKRSPKVQIDHHVPCGDVLSLGYIQRLFVPSAQLWALCHDCHKIKTKADNASTRANKKKKA